MLTRAQDKQDTGSTAAIIFIMAVVFVPVLTIHFVALSFPTGW
jgi:hypothetical protein